MLQKWIRLPNASLTSRSSKASLLSSNPSGPSNLGKWVGGAAQRRLRALAPEIARLQAVCATQATEPRSNEQEALSNETGTPDKSRSVEEEQSTLLKRGSAPASEEAADRSARRQRLLALQQELAQLKRTPSMQLRARQRIPRLEETIKHLIASLEQSA